MVSRFKLLMLTSLTLFTCLIPANAWLPFPLRPGDEAGRLGVGVLSVSELKASLKVVASRNHAYYGFNTPEIQIHLPLLQNSSYARLEMPEPVLKDVKGRDVTYKLERGLHDLETQIMEIRFLAEDEQSPAEFARAVGEIRGTYPLRIEILTVKAGQKSDSVRIEGGKVAVKPGVLPELPPFLEVHPLQAFDKSGKSLKVTSRPSTFASDENAWLAYEFGGEVARVELHTVGESAEIYIRYDVPIAPPLPDQNRGSVIESPRAVSVDSRSHIEIKVDLVEKREPAPATKPKATAPPTAPDHPANTAKRSGKSVPMAPATSFSADAKTLHQALADLKEAVPQPWSVVQLMYQTGTSVTLSVSEGKEVQAWTWTGGQVSGPNPVDTQWLQCKQGMPTDALNLDRLPSILDHAAKQVGDAKPMQMVVGQGPCGTASIYIPFDNSRWVQYEGDGILKKVE